VTIQLKDINQWYQTRMYDQYAREYYENSDFFNFGYWLEDTPNQKAACENLMAKLLDFLPQSQGRILDVACGKGATTNYLLQTGAFDQVMGVDVSLKQLRTCQDNAPQARFTLGNATGAAFADASFEQIICVEAAFHFDTRADFLREARRLLKPGGYLLLTDILLTRWGDELRHIRTTRNYVPTLAAYRNIFLEAGFLEVEIIDATLESWTRFYRYMLRWHWQVIFKKYRDFKTLLLFTLQMMVAVPAMRHYLLVAAKKA